MEKSINRTKARLKAGELALGMGLRQARTVDTATIAGTCAEMGMHGDLGNPRVQQAYEKVIAACARHGKFPGTGGVYDPKLMDRYIRAGMRLILSGNDLAFLMAGARERTSILRSISL